MTGCGRNHKAWSNKTCGFGALYDNLSERVKLLNTFLTLARDVKRDEMCR